MDDIAEQLAIPDRFRKKPAQRQTPSERMAAMARLHVKAWNIIRRSPEGYARFLRRNFKARAIDVRELHDAMQKAAGHTNGPLDLENLPD